MPPDPLVNRDFVTPNGRFRVHIANILNYATPGLTNKKRLGTPLNAFIKPHLQYCSTVWHFCSTRNRDKLESLNKRALRVVFNDKVSSQQQLLYKSEGSTLYNRRIQNMLITIHKCLNCNNFPKYLKDMFPLRQSEYSFRKTNILSLCKPVTSTYGLNSFRYFASKNWNSLPNNVRSESTLSGFRRLLKTISF